MSNPSFWLRPEPSSRQPRLSRAKIAAAALDIADREGFAEVSMRRVAQALDAGTMSLYYYVKTRDELVALMDDALMAEALLPAPRSDWPGALLAIAKQTHALFMRHPWALATLRTVPPGPNTLRHGEQCLHALRETSLSAKQKLTLLALVDDFVFGNALRSAESRVEVDLEFVRAQLATGAFPELSALYADGRIEPNGDRFERGLEALLATALAEPPARVKPRRTTKKR
ncbi:MAG TPA: TetR/AcrR family transcriptional regulator C-terminal domain-containing protein [Polyangiaceae bacterium]|nr:TetR/AcrR family transcriptional regulator C-terminal domain-containing protein [Polyangiaceae bacterium]